MLPALLLLDIVVNGHPIVIEGRPDIQVDLGSLHPHTKSIYFILLDVSALQGHLQGQKL